MTPEELKISIINRGMRGLFFRDSEWVDNENSIFKYVWEVTGWDKKFQEVEKFKQKKVFKYSYVLAKDFEKLEVPNGSILLLSTGKYVGYTDENKARGLVSEGEVVTMPWGGGPTIKYYSGKFVTADNRIATSLDKNILSNKFFYYFMLSKTDELDSYYRGTSLRHPKMKLVLEMRIPIPEIEEQKRIVDKIEELLPLVDKYEEAWTKLEKLNNQFPIDMERSILQYAMQGKLVKSAPSEGTGQELFTSILKTVDKKKINKYEKINIENCPFEIPLNWEWVRLGMIFNHSAGKALNSSDREGKEYQYITTSNVYWNSFDLAKTKSMFYKESELERCSAKKGDLLVLEGGDVGRAAIWNYDYDIRIQNHIHCIRNVNHLNIKFFYYLFFLYKSIGFINGKGIGIQGLSANVLDNLVLPLPPVEEQNRIVSRIEELLPLCRSLK